MLGRRTDEDVEEALTCVRGIGPWTAHMFCMFTLARPDVWPTGDYGVRAGWSLLHGDGRARRAEGARRARRRLPAAPQRGRVVLLARRRGRAQLSATSLTVGSRRAATGQRGALLRRRRSRTLETYARIPCLSPNFDAEWAANGHLDAAAELLAAWARGVGLHGATVDVAPPRGAHADARRRRARDSCDADGTVVLYGHLDKQPPLGEWAEGLAPFEPVRREDRLYARGVADDGYAIFVALLGLAALERDEVGHARCVVLIEASEESSSPDLEAHLDVLADELGRVDLLICLDSGALTYDRLWVTTSLRGMVIVTVTIEVLHHGVHSGVAGAWSPRRSVILRELLDRLENPRTGEVLLRELHAKIPDSHLAAAGVVARDLGDPAADDLPVVDGLELLGRDGADRLVRRTWEPSLSVIGMAGIPEPADAAQPRPPVHDRGRSACASPRRSTRRRPRGPRRAPSPSARRTAREVHRDRDPRRRLGLARPRAVAPRRRPRRLGRCVRPRARLRRRGRLDPVPRLARAALPRRPVPRDRRARPGLQRPRSRRVTAPPDRRAPLRRRGHRGGRPRPLAATTAGHAR